MLKISFIIQILKFISIFYSDADVTVLSITGVSQNVRILGIDDYGYLRVRGEDGAIFTVHPDGNTFDCLKGLIAPK